MSDEDTTRAPLGAVHQWSDADGVHLFAPLPAAVMHEWTRQWQRRLDREATEHLLERHTYVRETQHPDGQTMREAVLRVHPVVEGAHQLAPVLAVDLHAAAVRITDQQRKLNASTARLQALLSARGMPNAVWFDEALREPEVDPLAGVREVVARHLPREASW